MAITINANADLTAWEDTSTTPQAMPSATTGKTFTVSAGKNFTAADTVQATSKAFAYNLDNTLNTVTDTLGAKTMVYSAGGLTSVVGSGQYRSKSFTYDGSGNLTGVTVT